MASSLLRFVSGLESVAQSSSGGAEVRVTSGRVKSKERRRERRVRTRGIDNTQASGKDTNGTVDAHGAP